MIVTGPRYQFSGEEILLVCVAKIATGDPWTRLIDGFFVVTHDVGHMHFGGL
jgi:hypothetical protein